MSLFDLPPIPDIPVLGEAEGYPVRRIFCVGRNYAAHAAEMGYEVDRETPFYFAKTPANMVLTGASAPYPGGTDNYHFEIELAVAMGAGVFQCDAQAAAGAIYGYCSALDMTRRDLQLRERKVQRPWMLGKDVEQSAVFAPITKADAFTPDAQRIWLTQNGEMRQTSTLDLLVHKIPELIAHLSTFYHLAPGDLILTGTPEGVGPVQPGDVLEGGIDGLTPLSLTITELA